VVLSEAGSVQHATQQAPEAAAARLRSGAEAPRVKQARRRHAARHSLAPPLAAQRCRRRAASASARGPWPRSLGAMPLDGPQQIARARSAQVERLSPPEL
jgi:hypothetical protein